MRSSLYWQFNSSQQITHTLFNLLWNRQRQKSPFLEKYEFWVANLGALVLFWIAKYTCSSSSSAWIRSVFCLLFQCTSFYAMYLKNAVYVMSHKHAHTQSRRSKVQSKSKHSRRTNAVKFSFFLFKHNKVIMSFDEQKKCNFSGIFCCLIYSLTFFSSSFDMHAIVAFEDCRLYIKRERDLKNISNILRVKPNCAYISYSVYFICFAMSKGQNHLIFTIDECNANFHPKWNKHHLYIAMRKYKHTQRVTHFICTTESCG